MQRLYGFHLDDHFVVYEQVTPEARSEVHIVVDNGYWLLTFDFQPRFINSASIIRS